MADIRTFSVLPEGKPPWITQDEYEQLQKLYDNVDFPEEDTDTLLDEGYAKLYAYLIYACGLVQLPVSRKAIHYNTFEMFRRGYKEDK